MSEQKLVAKDYKGNLPPVWCPGCGDFGVLSAMQRAVAERAIPHEDLVFVSGIGCSSRFPHFMKAYGFHSCHGRALPVAMGAHLGNQDLKVVVVGGDGDGMAIGAGHFLHAARRNPNMTYVMMDNEIYGLTKGQASPTSAMGLKSKSTPYAGAENSTDAPLNPMALAIASGATWVGRAYSGKIKELVQLIGEALDHDGYAYLQVISPCVTFHDIYEQAKAGQASVPEDHDVTNRSAAMALAMDNHWATGVFYKSSRPTFGDAMTATIKGAQDKKDKGLAAIAAQIRGD